MIDEFLSWYVGDVKSAGNPADKYSVKSNMSSGADEFSGGSATGFPSVNTSNVRSDIAGIMPTNPKHDLTPSTRVKLIKTSRALTRSSGAYTRLTKTLANYAIGNGLMPSPTTDDEEFNTNFAAFYENWAKNPELCDKLGQRSITEMQKASVSGMISDGEKFFAKQKKPFYQDSEAKSGIPQLLMIDPLNVGGQNFIDNKNIKNASSGRSINDGLEIGADKKVKAYYVRDEAKKHGYVRVPAHKMVHVYNSEYLCNYRGYTMLHSGQNSGVDILDLMAIEKHVAKLQALMAVLIKRCDASDDLSKTMQDQARSMPDLSGGAVDPNEDDTAAEEAAKNRAPNPFVNLDGAKIFDGADGFQDIDLKSPDRPNLKMIEFTKALYKELAWGLGVTYEFIFDITEGSGANTRFVIQDAMQLIEDIQSMVITRFCNPVYKFVAASAMQAYEETNGAYGVPRCTDPNWWSCEWSRPKQPTVDIGRDGKLISTLIANGLMSKDRYYKMQGLNPKVEDETAVKGLKRALELCEKHGVPYEYLNQSVLGKTLAEDIAEQVSNNQEDNNQNDE